MLILLTRSTTCSCTARSPRACWLKLPLRTVRTSVTYCSWTLEHDSVLIKLFVTALKSNFCCCSAFLNTRVFEQSAHALSITTITLDVHWHHRVSLRMTSYGKNKCMRTYITSSIMLWYSFLVYFCSKSMRSLIYYLCLRRLLTQHAT